MPYNKEFLKMFFGNKLKSIEDHIHSIDESNPANLIRMVILRSKVDLMEELMDDLSLLDGEPSVVEHVIHI